MKSINLIPKAQISAYLFSTFTAILLLLFSSFSRAQHPTSDPDNYFTMLAEYEAFMANNPSDTAEDGFIRNFEKWKWFWEGRASSGDSTNIGSFEVYLEKISQLAQLGPLCVNETSHQLAWEQLGPTSHFQHRQGRVDIVLPAPEDENRLYAGTPSSGLWRCDDISATTPYWFNLTDHLNMPTMGVLSFDIEPNHGDVALVSLGYKIGISKTKTLSVGLYRTDNIDNIVPNWTRVLPFDSDDYLSKITKVKFDDLDQSKVFTIMNNSIYKSINGGSTFDPIPLVFQQYDPDSNLITIYDFILDKNDHNVMFVLGEFKYLNDDEDAWLGDAYLWRLEIDNPIISLTEQSAGFGELFIKHNSFRHMMRIDVGQYGTYLMYKNQNLNGHAETTIKKTTDSGFIWDPHIKLDSSICNQMNIFDVSHSNDSIFYYEGEINPISWNGDDTLCSFSGRELIKYVNGNLIRGTRYNADVEYLDGTFTHADIRGLHVGWSSSDGLQDQLYLGSDGGVLYSENSTQTYINWTDVNGEGLAITQFFGMGQQYDASETYGGGCQDNGIMIHRSDGLWHHEHGGDGYELMFEKSNGQYAMSENNGGTFTRSTNYAFSFSDVFPDDRPPEITDVYDGCQNSMMKQPIYNDRSDITFVGYHDVHRNDNHGVLADWEAISDFSGSNNSLNVPGHWVLEELIAYKGDNNIMYAAFGGPTWNRDMDNHVDSCFSDISNYPSCTSANPCDLKKKLFRTDSALAENTANIIWEDITPGFNSPGTAENILKWKAISAIAISDKNPDHIWASFNYKGGPYDDGVLGLTQGNKRVTRSTDGGQSWIDYSDGLPVFPVTEVMYLDGSNNGVFAGTDLGIYYTDDDIYPVYGWLCVNKQLPPVIISDIDINYCSNEVLISTFGRGMYKADLSQLGISLDVVVDTNETWNSPRDIAGNLTISNGAVLTITSELFMAEDKYIIIEQGSELIVDGGTLTNGCGKHWRGVQVRGNASLSQSPTSNQGMITLLNNATISNAYIGIRNYGTNNDEDMIWSSRGGIINATNSNFYNNKWDLKYSAYHFDYPSGNPMSYNSSFDNCYFTVDDGAVATSTRITMWNVYNISFNDCKFEDNRTGLTPFEKSVGIVTVGANYKMTSNDPTDPNLAYFKNFKYGIKSDGLNNSGYSNFIEGVYFSGYKGIYFTGISNATIINNEFTVIPTLESGNGDYDSPYGLYLDMCKSYTIQQNDFISTYSQWVSFNPNTKCIGVLVKNNHKGAEEIRKNKFRDFHIAAEAIGQNRVDNEGTSYPNDYIGLEFLCNEFTQNKHDIYITQDLANPVSTVGIARLQGDIGGSPSDPAGNLFTDPNIYYPWYKFFNDNGIGEVPVYYTHHTSPSNLNLVPDPVNNNQEIKVIMVPYPVAYSEANSCASYFLMSMSSESEITELSAKTLEASTELVSLETEYNTLVDGGNTQQLVTEVVLTTDADAWSNYQDLMQNAGYLSDEVLSEVSTKEDGFNTAMIRNVLVANPQASKSSEIQSNLDNRIDVLPQYMRDQIDLGITQISPKEFLELSMGTQKSIHDKSLNKLIYLLQNDTVNDRSLEIITALSETGDLYYDYKLIEYYDEVGQFELADALLQVIESYLLSDIEQSFFDDYTNYRNLINQWESDNLNLATLDSTQLDQLVYFTELNNTVAAEAIGLQRLNGINTYNEPAYFPTESEKSNSLNDVKEKIVFETDLNIYPNPAETYFTLDYSLVECSENCIIVVVDASGKILFNKELMNDNDMILISTENWRSGIYSCSLIVDGKSIISKKISILK